MPSKHKTGLVSFFRISRNGQVSVLNYVSICIVTSDFIGFLRFFGVFLESLPSLAVFLVSLGYPWGFLAEFGGPGL